MVMVKFINALIVFSTVIFLSGCLDKPETDVAAERIYTAYNLTYNEESNQTFARAVFSADTPTGWRQELSGSARVEFMGVELKLNEGLDEYLIIFDDFKLVGDFIYLDKNGDSYLNSSELKLIGYPSGLDTASVDEDFKLEWVGDALEDGEFVTLSFEEESIGILDVYQIDEVGAESITIPQSELQKFAFGSINLRLAWEKLVPTNQDPGVGGEVHSVTLLAPKPVVFF